jgi:hypothetical protein
MAADFPTFSNSNRSRRVEMAGDGGDRRKGIKSEVIIITKLAESQASEQTLMAISGHVSQRMIEHYSHIRMEAKRVALDSIVRPDFDSAVAQNWAQSPDEGKTTATN